VTENQHSQLFLQCSVTISYNAVVPSPNFPIYSESTTFKFHKSTYIISVFQTYKTDLQNTDAHSATCWKDSTRLWVWCSMPQCRPSSSGWLRTHNTTVIHPLVPYQVIPN